MNPNDVVIPINSRWIYTAPDAKPGLVFMVVALPSFHVAPDTWTPAVMYRAYGIVADIGKPALDKVRTKADFLAAFRPA